jgi:N-acetylglucosaminylphosphatidylinositol deacetylase
MVVTVIVIAHPDDESMFFLPTIRGIVTGGNIDGSGGGARSTIAATTTTTKKNRSGRRTRVDDFDDDDDNNNNNNEVWLLCLTTGNYDGLGKKRTKELIKACTLIGITKLVILDDDDDDDDDDDRGQNTIRDHPKERWDPNQVAMVIRQMILGEIGTCYHTFRDSIDQPRKQQQPQRPFDNNNKINLITFDDHGVSGHINHIDTYYGVCQLIVQEQQRVGVGDDDSNSKTSTAQRRIQIESAWKLHTEQNILYKYFPLWSWIILLISIIFSRPTSSTTTTSINTLQQQKSNTKEGLRRRHIRTLLYRLNDPTLNWKAMAVHHSQFVWYRRLFVVFSCYTYYNILTEMY